MKEFDELLTIMAALRAENGCPWDREQSHETLVPYMVEEAYEVIEAIAKNSPADVCEELGDLLLQIVFHGQIAQEEGTYTMKDIVSGIRDKLIRRHPHVFASARVNNAHEVTVQWNEIKEQEKGKKKGSPFPVDIPAIQRAQKLQSLLSKRGFCGVEREESVRVLEETLEKIKENPHPLNLQLNPGQLLFHAVNIARSNGIDPEIALRQTCAEFEKKLSDT